MSERQQKIINIMLYGDEDDKTTLHHVRDSLAILTKRKVSLSDAAMFCIERQGDAFMQELVMRDAIRKSNRVL